MLGPIAEAAAFSWPLALTLASVAVVDRVRWSRRREALNCAVHELRRPLQALLLARPAVGRGSNDRDHLALALEALGELDRELNGRGSAPRMRVEDARALAVETAERWHLQAALAGRRIELVWRAGRAAVLCDPSQLARALDNLIANALEHGGAKVMLEGTTRSDRLRLVVADGADAGSVPEPAGATPRAPVHRDRRRWPIGGSHRRGHGLRIVAGIAAEHGGRFAICRHPRGASAVLELPLADQRR